MTSKMPVACSLAAVDAELRGSYRDVWNGLGEPAANANLDHADSDPTA